MHTNVFSNPDVDLPKLQDLIAQAYVTGPDCDNANADDMELLLTWVAERYVAGHILSMVVSGHLDVNMKDGEPTFTNTEAGLKEIDAHEEEAVKAPILRIVK